MPSCADGEALPSISEILWLRDSSKPRDRGVDGERKKKRQSTYDDYGCWLGKKQYTGGRAGAALDLHSSQCCRENVGDIGTEWKTR